MAPYYRELGAAFGLYGLVLVASILMLTSGRIESGMARHAIALSPMLPGGLVCWAILRQMRRLDELQLRVQLEAVGFAFAVTALLTFSYGFLEGQGWPKLSMFVVWPIMGALWMVGTIVSARRYR